MVEEAIDTGVIRRRRRDLYVACGVLWLAAIWMFLVAIGHDPVHLDGESGRGVRIFAAATAAGALIASAVAAKVLLGATLVIDSDGLRQHLRSRDHVVPRARVVSAASFVPPDGRLRVAVLGSGGPPLAILTDPEWEADIAGVIEREWGIRVPHHGRVSRRDMKRLHPAVAWPRTEFTRGYGGPP